MSTTATAPSNEILPEQFIQSREHCVCPQCDSEIQREHVLRKTDLHRSTGPTRQTVTAVCVHCNVGYEQVRRLFSGEWVAIGNPRRITDPRELRRLRAEIDQFEGVIQRGSSRSASQASRTAPLRKSA